MPGNRLKFVAQRDLVSDLVCSAKARYYNTSINEAASSRDTWSALHRLLNRHTRTSVSCGIDSSLDASAFCNFFADKIDSIRNNFRPSCALPESVCDCRLEVFDPVSYDEASRVLKDFKAKSCSLDPIPTWVVKRLSTILIPFLCKLTNASLATGVFPTSEKGAIITPVLKKGRVDKDDLGNYRPVSCLSFLSKFIERLVYRRLIDYFNLHSLMPSMQSAYRPGFSTETAICKLINDLLVSSDLGNPSVVVMLDLGAAFDTVDHVILLNRLRQRFGLYGTALLWVSSYLTNRTQCVKAGGCVSGFSPLSVGVPQGSVLGPLLFTVYTAPLCDIISLYGLNFVTYADDITIYCPLSLQFSTVNDCSEVVSCLHHIDDWFAFNRLLMNPSKTEVFVCGPRAAAFCSEFNLFESSIFPADTIDVLGVRLDRALSMKSFVSKIRRSAFSTIRSIYRIRRYLSERSARLLFHALILPYVDYCNVTFVSATKKQ